MANHGSAVVSLARPTIRSNPASSGSANSLVGLEKTGPTPEVARPGQDRRVELLAVVSRDADVRGRAHDPPGIANRKIFLPDVHAVAARQPGQVHAIVENQGHACLRGQDANLACSFQELAIGKPLLAILDHIGAAGQGLAHDPGEITQRGETADQAPSAVASPRLRWAETAVMTSFSIV